MSCLNYINNVLHIEKVNLEKMAHEFGTPCYLYSRQRIENNWRELNQVFQTIPHQICYAVKANSNLAILNLLVKLQSGFDIVSAGELARVLKSGGDPNKIVFSGVGKTIAEMEYAISQNIHCFDIESAAELSRLQIVAKKLNKQINIALRINPDVDAQTHPHIATGLKENKFGIESNEVISLARSIVDDQHVNLIGIATHIGSQITELEPFMAATKKLADVYLDLKKLNINISEINVGGGLGITYHNESPPALSDYANIIINQFKSYPVKIILEPGRSIVANAGVLLTRVEYIKTSQHKKFAIVDAGMNDLIRPALYDAWQPILPVILRNIATDEYDIVGPVCETADFLGKNRSLAIQINDLLAIDCAGAYGFSMSSNYNSRPRPAEILIDGEQAHLIRRRESLADLMAHELLPNV